MQSIGSRVSTVYNTALLIIVTMLYTLGFPGGSAIKNLPAMRQTWVQSLSWEDALEEEIATCFSILAWEIPDTGALQAAIHGVTRVGHNLAARPPPPLRTLYLHTCSSYIWNFVPFHPLHSLHPSPLSPHFLQPNIWLLFLWVWTSGSHIHLRSHRICFCLCDLLT